jgi:hypothetical protein
MEQAARLNGTEQLAKAIKCAQMRGQDARAATTKKTGFYLKSMP